MKDCKDQEIAIGDYVIITEAFRDRVYLIVPWAGEWQQPEDALWVRLCNKPQITSRWEEAGWVKASIVLKIPEEYIADQKKLDLYLKLGGIKD